MNGYERTVRFVNGEPTDRPPFMPLTIEWVSRQMGMTYPEFIYEPDKRIAGYSTCVEKFDFDCVLPDADFFEQLEDFGSKPVYDGTAFNAPPIIEDVTQIGHLVQPEYKPGTRMGNRLKVLSALADKFKGKKYIFGIAIGPFTEFCNARGVQDGLMDLLDDDEATLEAMQIFFENDLRFIDAQMDAGADGIQIVEPCCSLISPKVYGRYIQAMHKKLVKKIQDRGGFARLHICGDTNELLPYSLGTGTRILDVDYAVNVAAGSRLLGEGQVFCGNLNPSADVLNGDPASFAGKVSALKQESNNRIIMAAGCDIPPATPAANIIAFHDAVAALAD